MSEQDVWAFLAWWAPRVVGVLGIALLADLWLRRRGVQRGGATMWKGVFVLLLVAPALGAVLPAIEVEAPAVPVVSAPAAARSGELPVMTGAPPVVARPEVVAVENRWGVVEWCLALWGLGAVVFGGRWLAGLAGTWRLRRRAVPVDWGGGTEVRESAAVGSPVLVGVLRPVVLVPEGSGAWSAERRRMVLLHERAHVAGGDVFFNLLAGALCAVQWFNPLAWLARRRLRDWQERAADEAVLDGGGDARGYARFLVELAAGGAVRSRVPMAAAAMARPGGIEDRVETILAWKGAPGGGVWARGLTVGVLGVVLLGISIGVEAKDGENGAEVNGEASAEGAKNGVLHTRSFAVPPDFLSWGKEKRETPKQVLRDLGVDVGALKQAAYDPKTSVLVILSTEAGMLAVEKALEARIGDRSRQTQIHLAVKVIDLAKGAVNLGKVGLPAFGSTPQKAGVYSLAAVITDPQAQVVFRALEQAGAEVTSVPSIYTRSGKKANLVYDKVLDLEVVGEVSKDGFTIDYGLSIDGGPEFEVTIWDGQTMGFVTKSGDAGLRYVFVSSRLLDPSGQAVNYDGRTGATAAVAGGAGEPVVESGKPYIMRFMASDGVQVRISRDKPLPARSWFVGVGDMIPKRGPDANRFVYSGKQTRKDAQGNDEEFVVLVDTRATGDAKREVELVKGVATDITTGRPVATVSETAAAKAAAGISTKTTSRVKAKLERIVVPVLKFDGATVEEAVGFLRLKSVELDTAETDRQKRGVNLIVKKGGPADRRVTLELRKVPLGVALKYVADLGGLGMTVEPYGVVLAPVSGEVGTDAPAGASGGASTGGATGKALVEKKLKGIVIPRLVFDQATFGEAVVFLRLKSAELDTAEKDPKKRGVNLIVKESRDDRADEAAERRVSLDLSNVPIGVALKYVCELARFESKVEPYGVVLTAKE